MPSIYSKTEIKAHLLENAAGFESAIRLLDPASFDAEPAPGKWSAGQHLAHLNRSVRPVRMALLLPKIILRWMFGRANRPSRSYDELVAKYRAKLAAGGGATGPYVPPPVHFAQKEKLLHRFNRENEGLTKAVNRFSDEDLDTLLLPHPLLGKLTLREMLFFTAYHIGHHTDGLPKG